MVHRFNIFLLSIALVIAQVITMNQALASNVGGWSMSNPVAKGASTVYTGIKNITLNGADYVKKGTAIVTPTATGVAKVLARGAGGFALSIAVEQLLGAVDWVLDPANNQIKYIVPSSDPVSPQNKYYWQYNSISKFTTAAAALESTCRAYLGSSYKEITNIVISTDTARANCVSKAGDSVQSSVQRVLNPAYDPLAKPEEKTLPLDVVAQKVISNAESGDAAAQEATKAAAADIVAEAETDNVKARPIVNQLEANAKTQTDADANTATGTQTQNPTKPETTDLALEFPAFCGWAPQVCEAAQVVISFPQTLTNWWETGKSKADIWAQSISEAWTSTKEWMNKEETPEKETVVDIDQTIPVVPNTSYFNWGAYCPFSPGSQTISLENTSAGIDYDLTSWCELASDIRPFVLAAGALMSFLIAAGVVMGRDD